MGRDRRAKQKWCSAAAAFLRRQNAELQTPRCEIGSAPRSVTFGFRGRRYFKLYFGIGRLWRGAVLFASKSDALFSRVNPSSGELGKNAL
jgi:hypothetical protein